MTAQLEAGALTDAQVQDVKDFMARVAPGMDVAEADFDTRRAVIEALDVTATLTVEDDEKVVHARCVVGDSVYTLRPAESLL